LNPNYDVINEVIYGFTKVVVERCCFHRWIAQRISWGEVVSVFLYISYSFRVMASSMTSELLDISISISNCILEYKMRA